MFRILLTFSAAIAVSHGGSIISRLQYSVFSSYTLYTNEKPNIGQNIQLTEDSVVALNITNSTNCAIIVHGINDRGLGVMSTVVRDALLTSGTVNVIIVDWAEGAAEEWATHSLEPVSNDAVELIRLLTVNNRTNPAKLHLIGFDLGAHIVGLIGRTSTYTIARITGLNPAKSLEGYSNALRRGDANYVEVIHTETTTHGFFYSVGHVDFYPHGGKDQPGCEDDIMCSHNRAWELFAASLTHGRVVGNKCPGQRAATSDKPCTGFTLALGTNDLVKYGSGVYRLETNPVYPYRCLVKCGLVDSIIKAIENISSEDDSVTDTTVTTEDYTTEDYTTEDYTTEDYTTEDYTSTRQ
ncbi:pancreatic triacylglycerol lipase-like [Hyposmocoma kahamanoa]|uniref:pancreatic triacylglycerol lipase-like n=1 Tax=Hyposmocoma kahamanoa TaxID=1477025 RepID=UPI000E6D9FAD|nr:pancreatic triacylglycerol lipase-like [Hyposmocoma kahamanoa]